MKFEITWTIYFPTKDRDKIIDIVYVDILHERGISIDGIKIELYEKGGISSKLTGKTYIEKSSISEGCMAALRHAQKLGNAWTVGFYSEDEFKHEGFSAGSNSIRICGIHSVMFNLKLAD